MRNKMKKSEQLQGLENKIIAHLRGTSNYDFRDIAKSTSWPYETQERPFHECFHGGIYYEFYTFISVKRKIIGLNGKIGITYHCYEPGNRSFSGLGSAGRWDAQEAANHATKIHYPIFVDYDDAYNKLNLFYLNLRENSKL